MAAISIVIPVYNVEKYLCRCVASVLHQTFTDFELILVDDGSPDGCGALCDEYAKQDKKIRVIHKKNGGLSDARNAGIDFVLENNCSDWITFIDSDDWIHPKYLEKLYRAAQDTGCLVSVCENKATSGPVIFDDSCLFDAETVKTETFFCEGKLSFVVAWGKMYKKELFQQIRYPIGKLHEDEFVTYRILFRLNQVAYISSSLYYYYINDESITKARWVPARLDALEPLRNQIEFFHENGFMMAYKRSILNAAMNISKNYLQVKNTSDLPDKKTYYRLLSREMRRILRYEKAKEVVPFSEYQYLYEIAHPFQMKIYWYVQSIKSKLKRGNR